MTNYERGADVYHLPAIERPTEEQVGYFLAKAALLDEIFEAGGMTAERAAYERRLTLARIGMGQMFEPFGDAS